MKNHSHLHRHRSAADRRLARAEGHIRAIRRMIQDHRDCPELLIQLGAVRCAIEQVGLIVLKDHLASCFAGGKANVRKVLRDLNRALDQFVG